MSWVIGSAVTWSSLTACVHPAASYCNCLALSPPSPLYFACSWFPRLPILQGGTFTLLAPSMAMLSMPEWSCPAWTQNASLVNTSSPEFTEIWQSRMRAVSQTADWNVIGWLSVLQAMAQLSWPQHDDSTLSLTALFHFIKTVIPSYLLCGSNALLHLSVVLLHLFYLCEAQSLYISSERAGHANVS